MRHPHVVRQRPCTMAVGQPSDASARAFVTERLALPPAWPSHPEKRNLFNARSAPGIKAYAFARMAIKSRLTRPDRAPVADHQSTCARTPPP
jgi:hypothetical protein